MLVGDFAGAVSPARHDTPLVGADVELRGDVELPVDPGFEHAIIMMSGALSLEGTPVVEGQIAYVAPGRDALRLAAPEASRAVLLGGEPFGAAPLMWWNFVARTRDEIDAAYASWSRPDGRFGEVASSAGARRHRPALLAPGVDLTAPPCGAADGRARPRSARGRGRWPRTGTR